MVAVGLALDFDNCFCYYWYNSWLDSSSFSRVASKEKMEVADAKERGRNRAKYKR